MCSLFFFPVTCPVPDWETAALAVASNLWSWKGHQASLFKTENKFLKVSSGYYVVFSDGLGRSSAVIGLLELFQLI